MIKGNDWFTHDSAAKDDPKIMLLIDQMGLEGYGIFWILIETLRAQKDYKYRLDYIPSLSRRYATTQEKTLTVISNYGLFEIIDNEFFYSESLLQRMQTLDSKIEQKRLAGRKSGEVRRNKALMQNEHRSNTVQTADEQTPNKTELLDNTILDKIKVDDINTNSSIVVSVETPTTPKQTIAEKLESKKVAFKRLMWEFVKKSDNVPFWTDDQNAQSIRFYEYWTEHSPNARKLRWEKEKAFDIKRRLVTWECRNQSGQNSTQPQQGYKTAAERRKEAKAEADIKVNQMLLDRINGKR